MLVPHNFADRSICVLGLGYVGLTLAATMANVGFRIWGIEIRPQIVADLRKGRPHFHEPGLQDQLQRAVESGALTIHESIPAECDANVFIITVGTPLGPNGRARLDMIEHTSREVAAVMPDNALIVLRSTVRLGTTRAIVAPILEATGRRYDLAFCPERTLEGSALKELRTLPQIVGGGTLQATVRASQLFQFITVTTIRVANLETAETIKLVDNTQRDVHFAFSNEVARICDAVGVSAAEVINAGKLGYQRTNLPLPGPVGGPCLEKDPYIMAEGLEPLGVVPEITLAARRLNERQPAQSIDALKRVVDEIPGFPKTPVITVLGIAFKGQPETDDLRGTMARPILEALKQRFPGATFRGFDPVVAPEAVRDFGLEPVSTLAEAVAGANIAVITNNHPVFGGMPVETLSATMAKPAMIYDFWNSFYGRTLRLAPGTGYMALGSHGCALLPVSA